MTQRIDLKDTILENETLRYCEIYKITNKITNKSYVGQAVSHILNHNKYRPYGMEKRFNCHVSEAFSDKKNQCHYLNNSIRKHGANNFTLELLRTCNTDEVNQIESDEIKKHNTLFPNGYNLITRDNANHLNHTDESKKRVSNGVINHFKNKKLERFKDVKIDPTIDINSYIKPLNCKNRGHYGWYVWIDKKKADFGGVHISLEESKRMALDFIKQLK